MVLFALLLQLALGVMWVLVTVQFLFALITGNDNKNLRAFCDSLSQYIFQAIRFLTYNSEEKPFPFSDWPEAAVVEVEPVVGDEAVPHVVVDNNEPQVAEVDSVIEGETEEQRKKQEPESKPAQAGTEPAEK
jgi:hypothetical protein